MSRQLTSHLLMIRPVLFKYNAETALNNYYQKIIDNLPPEQAQEKALIEFDQFVSKLTSAGIEVIVIDDTLDPETPDSIFPNNWISFHHDGTIALYPMFAPNRRLERREDIIDKLSKMNFNVTRLIDLTEFEHQGKFLEGTGSMILDRDNHVVYAAVSERTNLEVLDAFCEYFSYSPIVFTANQTVDNQRLPIYHTNVMMCLTDKLAIVCLSSIDYQAERDMLVSSLHSTNKEVIDISEAQLNNFAGNMLAVQNKQNEVFLIMSQAAKDVLTKAQLSIINKYYSIISSSLDTIEALGGGSARCMMAEVFLPSPKSKQ